MRSANGRVKFGWALVRIQRLSSNFRVRARAPGFSSVTMALRAGFIIDRWRAIAFRVGGFSLGFNGARIPFFQVAGIPNTSLFLDPRRLIVLGGATRMRICRLRWTPRCRGNLRGNGNSGWWRGKPPFRRRPTANCVACWRTVRPSTKRMSRFVNPRFSFQVANRKSAPRRRGPGKFPDIDYTGDSQVSAPNFYCTGEDGGEGCG